MKKLIAAMLLVFCVGASTTQSAQACTYSQWSNKTGAIHYAYNHHHVVCYYGFNNVGSGCR